VLRCATVGSASFICCVTSASISAFVLSASAVRMEVILLRMMRFLEGVKWIGLSIFGVLEHYNLINNLAKIKKNIIMLSIRYRPPFWNITRNNGTLHEIKGLQGVLGCFAKTKKNIIMLSMTYKNKNDYITKPVILGITQQGYAPRSFENWHRASLTS
jgi:hypothetical protein